MKLGLFADPHYSSAEVTCGKRFNSRSLEKIRRALEAFRSAGCDLAVCLGDLIDVEPTHEAETANLREIGAIIRASQVPFICVMGNHDAFAFEPEEFYRILGCGQPSEITCQRGDGSYLSLLFLDTCYYKNGTHYAPGGTDWTDAYYPGAEALPEQLSRLNGDIYVFLHQNLDPTTPVQYRPANDRALRAAIEGNGRVKTVFQGHYHAGSDDRSAGVRYLTLPAMCEVEDGWEVVEL